MKEGLIAITFDDGFVTDLTVGLQAQLDRGMEPKGTSYIIPSWTASNRLSASQQLELVNNGWDLQCHSYTHTTGGPNGGSTGLTAAQLHQEMQNVNAYFETTLGLPAPEHHAYPGGASNTLMHNIWGRYRKTLRTTQAEFCPTKPNRYRVPSIGFGNTSNLAAYYRIIDACDRHGLYMIAVLHELAGDLVAHYGAILDYIKAKTNVRLVTISELYTHLEL